MSTTPPNLSELTVTCNRCGSAGMERIGNREYRCTHCGAITVVSQDDADRADNATTAFTPPALPYVLGVQAGAGTRVNLPVRRFVLGALALLFVAVGVEQCHSRSLPSAGEASATIPADTLKISDSVWTSSGNAAVNDGHYTALISNHGPVAVNIPRYTMTLYTDGVKGPVANSDAPLYRLLPGEYQPISFAFYSPSGHPRLEVDGPDQLDRNTDPVAKLTLSRQQLVRESGSTGYRLVGIVQNTLAKPVTTTEVLVMLFDVNHDLIAFGKGFVHTLRPGEKAAVNVDIPTVRNNAVASYEYLVDGTYEASK